MERKGAPPPEGAEPAWEQGPHPPSLNPEQLFGIIDPAQYEQGPPIPPPVAGCGLPRALLDLPPAVGPDADALPNPKDEIVASFAGPDANNLVAFEITSGCCSNLIAAFAERGQPRSRANPRQAREFA